MDKLNENTTSPEAADPQKRLNSEEQILPGVSMKPPRC